ncbi:hypothetical protein [Bacillus sp. Hm123]|uniref:hypothetical protein n=1 Tax=Bacillus sp. Hm123 TaxID=3450745 RepID=UPI003F442D42
MAKKIHVIELRETEFVQIEGTEEFTEVTKRKQKYPVYLTNYALSRGHDLGILKTSLITDLLKIKSGLNDLEEKKKQSGKENKEAEAEAVISNLDENKMMDVIYLAFLGANPNVSIDKYEFLKQYHAQYQDKVMLYFNIIATAVDADPNAFAKSLEKSTASSEKK